jgi:hypothetical protein
MIPAFDDQGYLPRVPSLHSPINIENSQIQWLIMATTRLAVSWY